MSTPVWIWEIGNNLRYGIKYEEEQIDLGGGIVKTVLHETPTTGYDGTGTSRSRYGTRIFEVTIQRGGALSSTDINAIFSFLQARKEAGNESFYFYYPDENATIDTDGSTTTGRYLVKHLGDVSLVAQHVRSRGFGTLTFTEDRS